jgi:hypothetical protein
MSTLPAHWTPARPDAGALGRRLPAIAFAVLCVGALAAWLAVPTYPAYDSLYSLVWAREVLHGALPSFDAYRAPTQHPLLLPVSLVLAPLGDAGGRLFVLLCIAGLLALVAAAWRLGWLAAGPLGALAAAGLVGSRLDIPLLAALGYLDIPYCALVVWAVVLEAERPRRGWPVWVLLAMAGLLRPEAWLLAGVYGVWMGWGRPLPARVRALLPAAVAPLLWALTDVIVTGDPLFSLRHTDALAAELHREVPLTHLPWQLVTLLVALVKPPVLFAGVVGGYLAFRFRRRALAVPSAVAVLTCFTYLIIASGGLATVYRYLLLTALGVSLLAAFAVAGWTLLPPGHRWRVRWAALAGVACLLGAAWTFAHLSFAGIRNDLRERRAVRADLHAVLTAPAVAAARRCGPITVPNHKLIPEVRWALNLPEGAVRARSDRSLAPQRAGVALVIATAIEERPALNVYEVPTDGTGILAAPRGFKRLAANRRFAAWGGCPA